MPSADTSAGQRRPPDISDNSDKRRAVPGVDRTRLDDVGELTAPLMHR